ncbi:MAG: sensor domain-containing diguanylate cyclase [Acidobacteriota bacterium]|nr:sensor domain-containing diguanylate cyclase [Acidobacteriota bacterium]
MFDRSDAVLLVGLAVALVVAFARPIVQLLDLARQAEATSGLALVPALVILAVALLLQQQGKRQFMKAQVAASAREARLAQERAAELEELVTLARSLARALDSGAVRDAVLQHLDRLAATGDVWVVIRARGTWHMLVGPTEEAAPVTARARMELADRALAAPGDPLRAADPIELDGQLCFPLVAGGSPVGVMGVAPAALADPRRRLLTTAAALLAISVRNAELFGKVREQSLRDDLTGCFNRHHALEVIDAELRRARRGPRPLSVIMFDLDRFKDVNDRHGHLCGDHVLAAVGRLMQDVLRGSDLKCRYGGDEFLVLLPETPLEGARRVAEGLRRDLAALALEWKGERLSVTGSFGVAPARPGEVDGDDLIARVDTALYRAKSEGRDCVHVTVDASDAPGAGPAPTA